MAELKHVGKVISNGRRCLVAYRTLPGDAYSCLIIPTESLQDSYHDSLMKLVESNAAQSAFEFYEVLNRSTFPDGSNMLISLHAKGHLVKVPTDSIEMVPNSTSSIKLSELNYIIAQQQGLSVQDLAIKSEEQASANEAVAKEVPVKPVEQKPSLAEPLSDEQLAAKYRNDAARLSAEAESLLKMAEDLSPTVTAEVVAETTTTEKTVAPKRPARNRVKS